VFFAINIKKVTGWGMITCLRLKQEEAMLLTKYITWKHHTDLWLIPHSSSSFISHHVYLSINFLFCYSACFQYKNIFNEFIPNFNKSHVREM